MTKVHIEMSLLDYVKLLNVLEEVSKYRGTGTASLADSILSKIRSGLIKVNVKEDEYETKYQYQVNR